MGGRSYVRRNCGGGDDDRCAGTNISWEKVEVRFSCVDGDEIVTGRSVTTTTDVVDINWNDMWTSGLNGWRWSLSAEILSSRHHQFESFTGTT